MRIIFALILASVGTSFALGWQVGPVQNYYVIDGCGSDAGKRILIARNGYAEFAIASNEPEYASVLEEVKYAFRNKTNLALYSAPSSTGGDINVQRYPLPGSGACTVQSYVKISGVSSK